MDAEGILALQAAIRAIHGVTSTWLRGDAVREVFGDVLVWEGEVGVFELDGHGAATVAYAWFNAGLRNRRAVIVLGDADVDSAAAAVRAMMNGASVAVTLPGLAAVSTEPPPTDDDDG